MRATEVCGYGCGRSILDHGLNQQARVSLASRVIEGAVGVGSL